MDDLKQRFDAAVAASKQLPERPSTLTLLRLYALYKQANEGDASGERPGGFVDAAKWDAWKAVAGMSRDDAMRAYADQVDALAAAG